METSEQSLVPPNVYQVHRNIPAQLDLPVPVKDRCSATESLMNCKIISNECKVRSRKGTVESTSSQTIELKSNIPFNGLLSTSTNRPESSSIVIGEHVEDCVMVELHGNVIKEDTSVQDQPGPYLIDEQVLVQVSNEEQRVQAQTSRSADVVSVYVKSMSADDKGSLEMLSSRSSSIEHPNTRSSVHVKAGLLESRFVFPELSKDEYPTISLPQGPQKENLDMQLEKEEDPLQMPMRKSAKKAKLKLKNLHEDYNVIRKINYLKKRKHYPLSPTDKGKAINNLEMEVPMADIPIWARYLTSVRIIDGNLIYGIASSKAILHQTLEGHSRSILCDYIKSHPCNFENRRNARSQECRVMWQHKRVKFDGVPFTIVTSDDLKCSFGMNYKLKRKKTDKAPDLAVNEEFGSEEDEEKPGEMSDVKEKNKATKVTVTPKKTYKDVMFTSCPAKITVKVIVKYPGYAVHPLSFHSERKARLKALRTDLSQKLVVGKEELYYVTIPVGSVHNHPLTGRSRNIHPSIISKVKELVQEGITSPKVIKRLLDTHIEMEHGNDVVTPHPDDRAYYPRMKDIGNLVYNYCKKMGIPSKGKNAGGQRVEGSAGKRKRHKSALSIGEYVECNDIKITDNLPLQASTLQEAVQTFCTDEPDRGNTVVSEQECASVNTVMQNTSSEVNSIAEIVRGQLDSLRNVTYTLNELDSLQDLCQSLQGLLNQYTPVNQQILQGGLGSNATPTAFIIHESVIDPLSVEDDHMQVGTVQESIQNSLTVPTRNAGCMVTTAKFRNTQVVENPHIRQFKPPVALQCLTTNVVPTLTMSQLPRSSSQSSEQGPAHLVTSIPSHSAANPTAVSITQPTYQTMTPITHDGSAVPVHLSLPPYFYYVQEVTVPDSSSTNSTLNGR